MNAKWKVIVLGVALATLGSGCGTIETYNQLDRPEDKLQEASIGSVIFRLNKSSDLPNAFGAADVFGGKVDRGSTELRLKGIVGSKLSLQVRDANKHSTETTMDRYGNRPRVNVISDISIGVGANSDTTLFDFDTNLQKELVIAGVRVRFIEISKYSVKYTLQQPR